MKSHRWLRKSTYKSSWCKFSFARTKRSDSEICLPKSIHMALHFCVMKAQQLLMMVTSRTKMLELKGESNPYSVKKKKKWVSNGRMKTIACVIFYSRKLISKLIKICSGKMLLPNRLSCCLISLVIYIMFLLLY